MLLEIPRAQGLHGAGLIAGNRLLDAVAGGAVAGEHAAEYAKKSCIQVGLQ